MHGFEIKNSRKYMKAIICMRLNSVKSIKWRNLNKIFRIKLYNFNNLIINRLNKYLILLNLNRIALFNSQIIMSGFQRKHKDKHRNKFHVPVYKINTFKNNKITVS